MSIADLNKAGLEQVFRDHLDRPEVRRRLTAAVPTPTAPSFAAGWSNLGGGFNTAGYYLDRGRVYLRGTVANSGAGTGLIFSLPPGFQPASTCLFNVPILGGVGILQVASTGTVTDATFSAGSKASLSLDGISFRVV